MHELVRLTNGVVPISEIGLGASVTLVNHPEHYTPAGNGTLVYFTAHFGYLANELGKVAAAGGKVFKPKILIANYNGYLGLLLDTEGNRMAIHFRKWNK